MYFTTTINNVLSLLLLITGILSAIIPSTKTTTSLTIRNSVDDHKTTSSTNPGSPTSTIHGFNLTNVVFTIPSTPTVYTTSTEFSSIIGFTPMATKPINAPTSTPTDDPGFHKALTTDGGYIYSCGVDMTLNSCPPNSLCGNCVNAQNGLTYSEVDLNHCISNQNGNLAV